MATRKPRTATPRQAAGDTVTISTADLSKLIADEVAKSQTATTQPLTRQLDAVLDELRSRPPVRPAADVDAGKPTRTRGTLVTADSTQMQQTFQVAFTAFDYRAYLTAAKPFAKLIADTCAQFNYQPLDAFIQIAYESGFNPLAKSSAGAQGLAQIMPDRANEWHIDPTDPASSIRALVVHMREFREEFAGDALRGGANQFRLPPPGEQQSHAVLDLALAAWDSSPEAVIAASGIPNVGETGTYVGMVGGTIRAILATAPARARWIEDWNALLR